MADTTIDDYIELLSDFLAKNIDAEAFERSYLAMFKQQRGMLPPEVFRILDRLFADVDAFCADPGLRSEDDLDENQLRNAAAAALGELGSYGGDAAR